MSCYHDVSQRTVERRSLGKYCREDALEHPKKKGKHKAIEKREA